MNDTLADPLIREILALRELPVSALRERYLAVFGEESTSRNKDYLFKRIAYRMQEQRYGGLSPRAKARAAELADKAPVRRRPPRNVASVSIVEQTARDPRLPPKLADVRRAYENVFPSLLGVRLANRVKEDVFRDMMTRIKAAHDLEPGRREALIAQYSDQLKGDFRKVYEHNL